MSSATYRYECAKTNRSGCQNSACKAEGLKIDKGDLRFGTLVTINEHTSWKWKHWGCVTPTQIKNIIEQLGGLDGLDLESDLDLLDGYDELPQWAQDKIKNALKQGHIDDEDWRGDPELNRPGQKGINKKTPKKKKKANEEESGDSVTEESPSKPKKGSKKSKKAAKDEEDEPIPKKKASRKRKAAANEDDEDEEAPPPKKKVAKAKSRATAIKDEDIDADEPAEPPKKGVRGKKTKQEAEVDEEEEAAPLPQNDGAAELDTKTVTKKVPAKRAAKRGAPTKDESESEEVTAKPPVRSSRGKKAKAETVENDDAILNDIDKKSQAKKSRAKKTAPAVIPEDEQTNAPQPIETNSADVKDEEEDPKGETETKSTKNSKETGRMSRSSRSGRSKA